MMISMVEPQDTTSGVRHYPMGDKTYTALAVDRSFAESTLKNDFQEITVKHAKMDSPGPKGILFFTAWKSK